MKKRLMSTALMAVVLFTLAFMTPALAPAVYAHPSTVTVNVTGFINVDITGASSNHKGTRIAAGAGLIDSFGPSNFVHELLCEPGSFLRFGDGAKLDDKGATFFTEDSNGAPDGLYSNSDGFPYRELEFKSDVLTVQSIDWIEEIFEIVPFSPSPGITCTIERFAFRIELNEDGSTTVKFNHFATIDFVESKGKSGKDKESFERHGHGIVFTTPTLVTVTDSLHD